MSENHTHFLLNLTFKAEEIDLYQIQIQSMKINYNKNEYSHHDMCFSEKCDSYFDDSLYISRTYYSCVENFNSQRGGKLIIKLKKNNYEVYETEMKDYYLNDVNVYYNVSFKSLNSNNYFQDPQLIKQTTELYQYIRMMSYCEMSLKDVNPKFLQNKITYFYAKLLPDIGKENKIEDIIMLHIHMRKNLLRTEADIFFRDLFSFNIDFSKIPLDYDDVLVQDYIVLLIKDLNENLHKNDRHVNVNRLFFVLNLFFCMKNTIC